MVTHSMVQMSYTWSQKLSNQEIKNLVNTWMGDCPTGITPNVTMPSYAVLHIYMSGAWLNKKAGLCAVMSMRLVHIKDHLWTIRFMPNNRVSNSSGVRWTGHDGKWLKWSALCEAASLYAPRELRWEEVVPLHKIVLTQQICQNKINCKALSTMPGIP